MQVRSPSAASTATLGTAPDTAFIALLAALTAMGHFGSNVLLPGLPAMAQELHVSASLAA